MNAASRDISPTWADDSPNILIFQGLGDTVPRATPPAHVLRGSQVLHVCDSPSETWGSIAYERRFWSSAFAAGCGMDCGGSFKNGIAQICLRFLSWMSDSVIFCFVFWGGPRMETCDLKFLSRVWVRILQDTGLIPTHGDSWHSLRLWFVVSLPRLSTQRQIFLHVCAAKVFSSFCPFLPAPSYPPPKILCSWILIVFWLGHVLLAGWDSFMDLFFIPQVRQRTKFWFLMIPLSYAVHKCSEGWWDLVVHFLAGVWFGRGFL